MTSMVIVSVLLCLSILFGAITALLLVPADLVAEACRPGEAPLRRALPRTGQGAPSHEPAGRRAT